MAKKIIIAATLTLGLMLGMHQVAFAEEIHEPVTTAETAPTDNDPEAQPENSSLETSVGGGNNSADSDSEDNTNQDGADVEDSEIDFGNWPIILSISAIVLALLFIIILNLRHRS